MQKLGMDEGIPIESKMVSKQIEGAQKRVEGQHFAARKHVLEYDDVMNKQREAIYGLRKQLLEDPDQKEYIRTTSDEILGSLVSQFASEDILPGEWDLDGLRQAMLRQYGFDYKAEDISPDDLNSEELEEALLGITHRKYDEKEQLITPEAMRFHERMLMLQIVDAQWKDHLLAMDHLKERHRTAWVWPTETPSSSTRRNLSSFLKD